VLKLICVSILARRPLESSGSEEASHAVVGMGSDKSVGSEAENNMRTQHADEVHQSACHFVKVCTIQSAVGVIQHLAVSDAEVMTGIGEFLAPYGFQLRIVRCVEAVGGPLSGSKANNGTLNASF